MSVVVREIKEIWFSPEVSVQRMWDGYYISLEPISRREAERRVGPFADRGAAETWAKAMAAERERKRLR